MKSKKTGDPHRAPADGFERKCTLEDLAVEFGCTPERVRQIEASALKKLKKHPLAKQLFREIKGL